MTVWHPVSALGIDLCDFDIKSPSEAPASVRLRFQPPTTSSTFALLSLIIDYGPDYGLTGTKGITNANANATKKKLLKPHIRRRLHHQKGLQVCRKIYIEALRPFFVLVIHITAGSTQNTRPANIEANHLQTKHSRRNYIHGNPERIWKSRSSTTICGNRVNRKPVHSSRLVISKFFFSFWEVFVAFVMNIEGAILFSLSFCLLGKYT